MCNHLLYNIVGNLALFVSDNFQSRHVSEGNLFKTRHLILDLCSKFPSNVLPSTRYLLFNVFFNLFFLWLIKRLSGTWASIGSWELVL